MSHQANVLTHEPSNVLLPTGKNHLHWCLSSLPAKDLQRLILRETRFIGLFDRAFTCPGLDVPADSFVVLLDTAFFRILSENDATTYQLLLAAIARELAPIVGQNPESGPDVLTRWGLASYAASPRLAPSVDTQHQQRLVALLQGPLRHHITHLRPRIIAARGVTWTLRGSDVCPRAQPLILLDQQLLSLMDGSDRGAEMVEGVLAHELAHIEYQRVHGRPSPPDVAGEMEIDAIAARWGFRHGLCAFQQHSVDSGSWLSEDQRQDAKTRIAALR